MGESEIIGLLTHEYAMACYGVLFWQLCNGVIKKNVDWRGHVQTMLKAMGWSGLIVIFDDEIMAQYNKFAELDYSYMPLYGYTVAGFFIDGVLNFIKK